MTAKETTAKPMPTGAVSGTWPPARERTESKATQAASAKNEIAISRSARRCRLWVSGVGAATRSSVHWTSPPPNPGRTQQGDRSGQLFGGDRDHRLDPVVRDGTMRWKPALNAFAITFGDRMPKAKHL